MCAGRSQPVNVPEVAGGSNSAISRSVFKKFEAKVDPKRDVKLMQGLGWFLLTQGDDGPQEDLETSCSPLGSGRGMRQCGICWYQYAANLQKILLSQTQI